MLMQKACYMTTILFVLILSSTSVCAQQAREYSTEGYCILAFEQVDDGFLKRYEQQLGFRPKTKLCNRVNRLVAEFQPSKWNYKFGQPYPGSSIYISPEQVEQINKAREASRHARR